MNAKRMFPIPGMSPLWMAGALALVACSSGTDTGAAGALPASAQVQRYGVYSYEVSGASVALLALDGSSAGVLRVTHPATDSRQVDIEYPGGARYTNDISQPVGGRFRAPVLETREGFIQADPALSSFFAAHALEFKVEVEAAADGVPQAVGSCRDVTFVSACEKCPENSAWPCSYTTIPGGLVAHAFAHCVALPGRCQYRDLIAKTRTCYAGGSCTQHALGFVSCSFAGPDYCGRRGDER